MKIEMSEKLKKLMALRTLKLAEADIESESVEFSFGKMSLRDIGEINRLHNDISTEIHKILRGDK